MGTFGVYKFGVKTQNEKHFNFRSIIFRPFYYNFKKNKAHLYDKRDTFYFSIIGMSHLDSNISSNIYYAFVCGL